MSEIHSGMNRDQVVQTLGTPDYTMNKDGAELLYYSYREDPAPVSVGMLDTNEAIDRRVEEISRSLKGDTFEIKMMNGKVIDSKKLMN